MRPESEGAYLAAMCACAALREAQLTFTYTIPPPHEHYTDEYDPVCWPGSRVRLLLLLLHALHVMALLDSCGVSLYDC